MSAAWRAMRESDLASVNTLADEIHIQYPEDEDVFRNKFHLYPQGCHVLESDGAVMGYMMGHPWHTGEPPALNTMISRLPDPAPVYFIHDLALHTDMRGGGHGMAFFARATTEKAAEFEAVRCIAASAGLSAAYQKMGYRVLRAPCLSYGSDTAFLEFKVDRQIREVV